MSADGHRSQNVLPKPQGNGRSPNGQGTEAKAAALIRELLVLLGEDPNRPGLRDTPHRASRALEWLADGYSRQPSDAIGNGVFQEQHESMVLVRDIELYSLCEHHMLPFFGRAHVAYMPNGRVVGLSKIARVVDLFARRLQVQERLTDQIADALAEALCPHGVGVIIEADHLCMMMRGVQKQNARTLTTAHRGHFATSEAARREFMQLAKG